MEDSRRDYSFGEAGVRLGRIFLGDWAAAHSPWADQFDLIVNCCHKEGQYRRCHHPLTPKAFWSLGSKFWSLGSKRVGVWEPQVMEFGVQASWSLGVWEPSSDSRSRRNVGFWVEMGVDMDVPTFERGVKKFLKATLKEENILVHCKQGKHRSGSFLIFVIALIEDGVDVEVLINEYLQEDDYLRPHDRGCVLRVWRESGLRPLLANARRDPEVKHLVAEIHARLDPERARGLSDG